LLEGSTVRLHQSPFIKIDEGRNRCCPYRRDGQFRRAPERDRWALDFGELRLGSLLRLRGTAFADHKRIDKQ